VPCLIACGFHVVSKALVNSARTRTTEGVLGSTKHRSFIQILLGLSTVAT
jgi:hypothetical protein